MDILFFLQEGLTVGGGAVSDAVNAPVAAAASTEINFLDEFIKGSYIYIPQIILSIISVY
ncbi:MAG: hypothetical protein RL204_1946, partial [Bacteroidota bacterium]